jgi:hypothetical protein
MSFSAEGTLVIESIENEATGDLQQAFSVSASGGTGRSGRNRTAKRITSDLDRGVDLDETRNDLLRDLEQAQEDSTFSITRALRSLGRISLGGLAGLGGGLATAALSESPNDGPQPSSERDPDSAEGGSQTTPDPVALTASDVIAAAATLTPAALVQTTATIVAGDVIGDKASVSSSDVVGEKTDVESEDVVSDPAAIAADDVVSAAVALSTGNIVTGAVALAASDVVNPVSLSPQDIFSGQISAGQLVDTIAASIGAGSAGALAGSSKLLQQPGKLIPSTGSLGAGIPATVLPQMLNTADKSTPAEIVPENPNRQRSGRAGGKPARVSVTNDVTVNNEADVSRRQKRDIVNQVLNEIEREVSGNL